MFTKFMLKTFKTKFERLSQRFLSNFCCEMGESNTLFWPFLLPPELECVKGNDVNSMWMWKIGLWHCDAVFYSICELLGLE